MLLSIHYVCSLYNLQVFPITVVASHCCITTETHFHVYMGCGGVSHCVCVCACVQDGYARTQGRGRNWRVYFVISLLTCSRQGFLLWPAPLLGWLVSKLLGLPVSIHSPGYGAVSYTQTSCGSSGTHQTPHQVQDPAFLS